ncbi:MAG: class I SAM-dependent methyltransferase [Pseudomonadota bacterium]
MKLHKLLVPIALAVLAIPAFAVPPDFLDKLEAPERPAEDKARDGSRRPLQVLQYLGIEEGMTVLDVAAGEGWFTEVLSAGVGASGKVIMQAGQRMLPQEAELRARGERLGNVTVSFEETWGLNMDGQADAAITAMSLHDNINLRGEEGVRNFLGGIYQTLKPGGILGIIDHIGNDTGSDNVALHRMPIDQARLLIQQNGFIILSESNMLRNNVDDHTLSNGDPALGRNTDQFFFKVMKPLSPR